MASYVPSKNENDFDCIDIKSNEDCKEGRNWCFSTDHPESAITSNNNNIASLTTGIQEENIYGDTVWRNTRKSELTSNENVDITQSLIPQFDNLDMNYLQSSSPYSSDEFFNLTYNHYFQPMQEAQTSFNEYPFNYNNFPNAYNYSSPPSNFKLETKFNDNIKYNTWQNNPIISETKPLAFETKKEIPTKQIIDKCSQREKLIREIEGRKLECLVCVEFIKPFQEIWSCLNCFHILHLHCALKWALTSKSDDGWRCPACQNLCQTVPNTYLCFCGKTKNPEYNRNDVAHTCGNVCGRKTICHHPCILLCHPGPCPFCKILIKRKCGCGKSEKLMQCYIKEEFICESICGKLLNCEFHKCEKICHASKCSNCTQKVDQECHCGGAKRQILCTRDTHGKKNFSCGKICSKTLSCGNHKCKDTCHPGECKSCKLSPELITACACGKKASTRAERKSCLDPIICCMEVCGKTLKCGPPASPHHCKSKCHLGNCPPCNQETAVRCRCGNMDQLIKCRQLVTRADDARCKKRCPRKRSCGKHKCNQECCIDIDHICPLPCKKNLKCGKHKCDQTCHKGNCLPCYRSSFEELYCDCGANVIYPPVPCGTKKPICNNPCPRQHRCDHPAQHTCHSASQCPPCMILTTKYCFGHHEQRKTIPCSQESFSCGLPCNKNLKCGKHKCNKPCHEGPCLNDEEHCFQKCRKQRIDCRHMCGAMCHEGNCPRKICKEIVETTCPCLHRKQNRPCYELKKENERINLAKLATSVQEMQRDNIEIKDIFKPLEMNTKILECNEECKLLERNRRLAFALQIRNPDTSSKLNTKYSDFIRGWAKKDPKLVTSIHDQLTDLVKLSKDSKQRSRSFSFPIMNREKRQLVHEMCSMFGVDPVSYDAEPNRNVVVTAYKEKSWLPAVSVIEVLRRESGQRRVPVPNNFAWGKAKK